jgi:hypothetical protein
MSIGRLRHDGVYRCGKIAVTRFFFQDGAPNGDQIAPAVRFQGMAVFKLLQNHGAFLAGRVISSKDGGCACDPVVAGGRAALMFGKSS